MFLIHLEHKKIKFDIKFYEYCMNLLTLNMNRIPFASALRNGSYAEADEDDEFNPGTVMNYEELGLTLTDRALKESRNEFVDIDKYINDAHEYLAGI